MNKRLVVYVEDNVPEASKILSCVEATASVTDISMLRETDGLLRALQNLDLAEAIFVVVVGTDARLDELLAAKELIWGKEVVLVLYCRNEDALTKSHLLHPRVLMVPPVEPNDLPAIVSRMLSRAENRHIA